MNRLFYIVFFMCLLPAGCLVAQEKGNVSVHTDPRLAVLLNKAKAVERASEGDAGPVSAQPKKNKVKVDAEAPRKGAKANAASPVAHTPAKEAKYLYNPDAEEAPVVERPAKAKSNSKAAVTAGEKETKAERDAYVNARKAERADAANNKSTDEEIREYRESIEKERGVKGSNKKIGKTGITADEVRYLTPTVSGTSRGGRYNGTGFRVQIYYGTSREEAMRRKAEFMRHYPGVPTYFSYATPTYRVKVGDYRRREDAISMFREANGTYSPCMIVPDVVAIH